jgi:hypothetical protein
VAGRGGGAWTVGLGAMLWKGVLVAIMVERWDEKAPIWVWMYRRKVSELHRPMSLIVWSGTWCR